MKVRTLEANNVTIDLNLRNNESQLFLLRSDAHWDNPKSDNDMEIRHLEEAKEKGAIILDFGDLFCAMEGKGDRRGAKNIRPEHVEGNYLDRLVATGAERYLPYAENFALIGRGNHEEGIKQYHETDLIERMVERMKVGNPNCQTVAGGLMNWITIRARINERNTFKAHYNIFAHHGYGGGGPVTKNTIQAQRVAASVEGADMTLFGHVHEAWQMETMKLTKGGNGRLMYREVLQLQLPTYKDEYLGNDGRGYHHIKGRPPKPLGAWWMELTFIRTRKEKYSERKIDTIKLVPKVWRAK